MMLMTGEQVQCLNRTGEDRQPLLPVSGDPVSGIGGHAGLVCTARLCGGHSLAS